MLLESKLPQTLLFGLVLGVSACGGGSSDPVPVPESPNDGPTVLSGVFEDSAVAGVTYTTATQSGTTDIDGRFNYLPGEMITFSIGNTQFPAVSAAALIRPEDIAAGSADPTAMTTNIARLLQSLDQDGNPENGITIPAEAATHSANIDFAASVEAFENNAEVINLVANSGSINTALLSATAALAHLNSTAENTTVEGVNGVEGVGEAEGIVAVEGVEGAVDTEGVEAVEGIDGIDIILDLRNSVWVESNETGCDGVANIVTITYTNTSGSATIDRAEDRGQGCVREFNTFDDRPFAEWENSSGFILVCGGDALCTFDELNREVLVKKDDARNDCTRDDEKVDVLHRVSHVVGSGVITAFNCDADDADVYVRQ